MYQSLLVAVDGSEHGKKALELASYLAGQDDASLHILHVPEMLSHDATLVWGIGAVSIEAGRKELEEAGRKVIERAAEQARVLGVKRVQTHVAQGEPARTIIRMAEALGVEVIVLGSRGLGNLAGLVMGSISHKVTHSAKCGVITVR
ncbi:universal stress protein [Zobellella sp. DQSA1]|uniref:universal stress protein n=1 Tax=Zobellella sp. DQSA1 TaxID=3342386 RepID=UPI0035BF9099